MTDIEKFVAKLSEDQAFAKQVGEVVENNEGDEIFNQLTALGKEHGLNVSAEELEEARKTMASQAQAEGELNEEDLEQVSGGGGYAGKNETDMDFNRFVYDVGKLLCKW